jgi:preprotein translocase subunit SecF
MEILKYKKPIALMSQSKKFGIFSILLVLLSLSIIMTKGFNYGIDFAGETLVQVKYEKDSTIKEIRNALSKDEKYSSASVTYFGNKNEVIIRTKASSGELGTDISDEMTKLLKDTGNYEIRRVDMVGAKVGSELREKGLMAMLLALLGILLYVSFRFEWRFAIASILALIHDVTIAMGAVALFGIEVNLDTLAALLTILGYSLNDTIIVFDRIREGIRTIKVPNLNEIIDESVTKTLSRTTLTSLTTFFVVFTLWMFGGEIIHGFGFTLLVGIIVGTYSSIFVASPILIWLKFSVKEFREKELNREKLRIEKEKMRAMYEKGVI